MANRNSAKAREICLATHGTRDAAGHLYMICSCGCGLRFNPATTRWRADHNVRHAEGGKETADNLWPIIEKCDAGADGKAAQDARTIAHGKRAGRKHFGVNRSNGFRKPPPGYKWDWKRGGLRRTSTEE